MEPTGYDFCYVKKVITVLHFADRLPEEVIATLSGRVSVSTLMIVK
ncbi:hypothetical protein M115_2986 [Bacteroides fragilis str. 3719 T6]|nr:hypothetical protein M085_2735 [Bacteroides fragilis str. 3986 N(B)19]EYA47281.1 hypothetical protein M115_2986 [Bacteroides fragilis str. 3719 T6]OCR30827.1 hypothetical protein AC140_28920 [Bacteroides fragilis]